VLVQAPNLLKQQFLPSIYEAALAPLQGVLDEVGLPSETGSAFTTQLNALNLAIMKQQLFAKGEAKDARRRPDAQDRLRGELEVTALVESATDLKLGVISHLAVVGVALAQAEDNEPEAARAYEIGRDSIDFRAQHSAFAILRATNDLFIDHSGAETLGSANERANEAHNRSVGGGSPVVIFDEEWGELTTLTDKAEESVQKFSDERVNRKGNLSLRSKLRNLRALRTTGATSLTMANLQRTLNTTVMTAPTPLILERDEIARSMRTTSKLVRSLGFAALTDPTLAQDPTVQCFAYLKGTLRAHDQGSELANFDRRIKKMTQRALKAGK
jgi:hypothetical protein